MIGNETGEVLTGWRGRGVGGSTNNVDLCKRLNKDH